MTRRFAFVVAVVALVLWCGAGVAAQQFDGSRGSFPGCPTCGVWSWVDLPAPEMTVSASNFVVQGWGFECVSGQPVDRVDVSYQDYDGHWNPLLQPASALTPYTVARPDVAYMFAPFCPNVSGYTGWQLVVTNPPPLGLRRVAFTIWRGPYFERHQRVYLIVK